MKIIVTFFLLLFCLQHTYSENPEYVKVSYIPLEMESPYRISPNEFDRLYTNDCECVVIKDSLLISDFMSEIECLQDTIIERHVPNKIYKMSNGECVNIQLYPSIDTRGKITIVYSKRDIVLYYSQFKIWNSTDDVIFRMSESLIRSLRRISGESSADSSSGISGTVFDSSPQ